MYRQACPIKVVWIIKSNPDIIGSMEINRMRQVIQAAVHIGRSYFLEVLKWMRKFGHLYIVFV